MYAVIISRIYIAAMLSLALAIALCRGWDEGRVEGGEGGRVEEGRKGRGRGESLTVKNLQVASIASVTAPYCICTSLVLMRLPV